MAIAFDNSNYDDTLYTAQSWSFSYTIGSGTNRYLLVTFCWWGGADYSLASCSYNGVAMTKVSTTLASNRYGNYFHIDVFYMLQASLPATGAYNVTCTCPSGIYNGSVVVSSYSGVAQTAPEVVATAANNTSDLLTYSHSITTLTNNAWIIGALSTWSADVVTPGTGQTEFADIYIGTDGTMAMSYEAKATAGSETESWTWAADTSPITMIYLMSLAPYVTPSAVENAPFFGCNF